MKIHLSSPFLSAAAALLLAAAVRADDTVSTIKFSDPAKPGTIRIILARGDLRIRGEDTAEVSVKSDAKPASPVPRKDGLRVLTESSSFGLVEKDNVVTLDALSGWPHAGADFHVTVPRATAVYVVSSYGGDIACGGVNGDIEIKSLNGEVTLTDLAGGAIVETTNGRIHASVRELHDGKPLSFTSMNGEVVLRVPTDTKANVRLRTQNGAILTDFDEKALVTKTESVPRSAHTHGTSNGHDDIHSEIHAAVREAVEAGAQAAREVAAAAREAAQAAREAARADDAHPAPPMPPVPAVPPIPRMPPLPPMTGGKLVYGTLNGGGPEIGVTTMNGDVTLRQLEAKK